MADNTDGDAFATSDPDQRPTPLHQSDEVRFRIVLSYWLVILLGLPLWWASSSIERLRLPKDEIEHLARRSEELRMPVTVKIRDPSSSLAVFRTQFENTLWSNPDVKRYLDLHSSRNDSERCDYTITLVSDAVAEPSYSADGRHLTATIPHASTLSHSQEMADLVAEMLLPTSNDSQKLRVVQYGTRFRLAFTLLNEDASSGQFFSGWDLEQALQSYLQPTFNQLSSLHNFTIESQVQFHAPLAFKPSVIEGATGERTSLIGEDDLKVFVNSAEWTLASSVSNDPVLHFLLFIPGKDHVPLRIMDSDGSPSNSTAWIVPQWGGIVLLNSKGPSGATLDVSDLAMPFSYFDTQLRALLGILPLPRPLHDQSDLGSISPWQLDALIRRRTLENAEGSLHTLDSIVKLVDRIKGMPVGKAVRTDVMLALEHLEKLYARLHSVDSATTMYESAQALARSSSAFFHPTMVAMLYFPTEHKYAVYAPLFAPIAVPLLVTLFKEIRNRNTRRRLKVKGE